MHVKPKPIKQVIATPFQFFYMTLVIDIIILLIGVGLVMKHVVSYCQKNCTCVASYLPFIYISAKPILIFNMLLCSQSTSNQFQVGMPCG